MKTMKVVNTVDVDESGAETPLELAVTAPSAKVKEAARLYRARAWARAVEAGAMLRAQLDGHLRKARLWDEEKAEAFDRLTKAVFDGELALSRGGIRKSEARRIALGVSRARTAIQSLTSARNQVDRETAEALADQAQFNYLVAHCTVHNDGRREGDPYFTEDGKVASVDDYLERGTGRAANDAADAMSEILYGSVDEVLARLPENKFLLKYGFVDAKLRLVDKDGNLVDEDGRRVDEDNYYIDAQGNRVDRDGNRVDADGNYVSEFAEFLDDDDDEGGTPPAIATPPTPAPDPTEE